eukprot:scaffold84253_cov16-Tisochrysis_lutea.AAC.1
MNMRMQRAGVGSQQLRVKRQRTFHLRCVVVGRLHSPAPTTRARGAGLTTRAACSREASGGRNLPSSSGQQQEHQLAQQPAQSCQDLREEGMGDEGGGGRGELESPLHMLGDAALNTFGRPGGGPARLNANGKRLRKRPAGLGIQ